MTAVLALAAGAFLWWLGQRMEARASAEREGRWPWELHPPSNCRPIARPYDQEADRG